MGKCIVGFLYTSYYQIVCTVWHHFTFNSLVKVTIFACLLELQMIKLYPDNSRKSMIKFLPGQLVARKYRRNYLRKIQRREYKRLRKIVPTIADKKVDKVTILSEIYS